MSFLFLSHSSADDAVAEAVRGWLTAEGHESIFLDHHAHDGIVGGEAWEERLYTELRRCRALVALMSPQWLESPWCTAEVNHAQALRKGIIPLQIAGIEEATFRHRVPPAIRRLQIIGWHHADAQERLRQALTRAGLDQRNPGVWKGDRDPYPGLASFSRADSPVYFGRDQEITDLLDILNSCRAPRRSRLLLVQGASGTGKSSLVQAWLLPRLERYPERWLVLPPFRPARQPLGELASAFEMAAGQGILPTRPDPNASSVADWSKWIVDSAASLRNQRCHNDCTVLITIDQL